MTLLKLGSELWLLAIDSARVGEDGLGDTGLLHHHAGETNELLSLLNRVGLDRLLVLIEFLFFEESSSFFSMLLLDIGSQLDAIFGHDRLQLDESVELEQTLRIGLHHSYGCYFFFDLGGDICRDLRQLSMLLCSLLLKQLLRICEVFDILIVFELVVSQSVHQIVQLGAVLDVDLVQYFGLLDQGNRLSNLHRGSLDACHLSLHL